MGISRHDQPNTYERSARDELLVLVSAQEQRDAQPQSVLQGSAEVVHTEAEFPFPRMSESTVDRRHAIIGLPFPEYEEMSQPA